MNYPVKDTQIMKMTRKQLILIIDDYNLPITTTSKMKINDLRKLVIEELIIMSNEQDFDLEEILIVTGEFASDGNDQFYKSPSGTEIKLVMEEMLKGVDSINKEIKDFGLSVHDNEDDEYDESSDKKYKQRYDGYEDETRTSFENRTKMKYLRVVTPELLFQFIKSSFNEIQLENLDQRINALALALKSTQMLGQQGLYEELALKVAGIVKEQEAASLGFGKFIPYAAINFFIHKISKSDNQKTRGVVFDFFKQFPRIVPKDKMEIIKKVQDSKVFDQLYILYMNPTGVETETIKSKIEVKDPIVFGAFVHQPDRLYYITDWIDEWCDITLDKFIDILQEEKPELLPQEITKDITPEYIQNVIQNVNKSYLRLKKTNVSNYKTLIKKENNQRKGEVEEARKIQELPFEIKKRFRFVSWFTNFLK